MSNRFWFQKSVPPNPETSSIPVTYEFATLVSWIDNHFPRSDVASNHISHTDLVAERVLATAVIDFPDDPRPTQALSERKIARGALDEALAINADRFAIAPVRRQSFWNQELLKLRESLAHLVGLIMRLSSGNCAVMGSSSPTSRVNL